VLRATDARRPVENRKHQFIADNQDRGRRPTSSHNKRNPAAGTWRTLDAAVHRGDGEPRGVDRNDHETVTRTRSR